MTAEELLENQELKIPHNKDRSGIAYPDWWCEQKMVEFAKLHVEQALKAASCNAILASYDNKANKPGESLFKTITSNDVEWRPCSESILNAYPLTNIK